MKQKITVKIPEPTLEKLDAYAAERKMHRDIVIWRGLAVLWRMKECALVPANREKVMELDKEAQRRQMPLETLLEQALDKGMDMILDPYQYMDSEDV